MNHTMYQNIFPRDSSLYSGGPLFVVVAVIIMGDSRFALRGSIWFSMGRRESIPKNDDGDKRKSPTCMNHDSTPTNNHAVLITFQIATAIAITRITIDRSIDRLLCLIDSAIHHGKHYGGTTTSTNRCGYCFSSTAWNDYDDSGRARWFLFSVTCCHPQCNETISILITEMLVWEWFIDPTSVFDFTSCYGFVICWNIDLLYAVSKTTIPPVGWGSSCCLESECGLLRGLSGHPSQRNRTTRSNPSTSIMDTILPWISSLTMDHALWSIWFIQRQQKQPSRYAICPTICNCVRVFILGIDVESGHTRMYLDRHYLWKWREK